MTLALAGLLLTTRAQAQCSKDTECKADRVCADGKCVSPESSHALPPAPTPPAAPTPASPPAVGQVATDGDEPRTLRRRSPGLMATGIVLTSTALPFALFGAFFSDKAYHDCIGGIPRTTGVTSEQADRRNDCR